MEKKEPKLRIKRETLRELNSRDLSLAQGGISHNSGVSGCCCDPTDLTTTKPPA